MDAQFDLVAQQFAGELECLVHLAWVRGAGGVLEADAGKGHAGVKDLLQHLGVELGVVGARAAARQFHHGDDDFVLQAGIDDALARVDEVIDVVERVEIADAGHAVFLEHLGVQVDHVGRLLFQRHHVDAACQRLQADVRTDRLAEFVHHVEGRFVAIEERCLEARTTAGLKVRNARGDSSLDGRHEIAGEYARTEDGLETVAESSVLEKNSLGHGILVEGR